MMQKVRTDIFYRATRHSLSGKMLIEFLKSISQPNLGMVSKGREALWSRHDM